MGETLPQKGQLVPQKIKDLFKEKMYELIADIGQKVTIVLPPSRQDCPNCGISPVTRRSNNRYNVGNPNPLGPLNKPFSNGQTCPVCGGQGSLNTPSEIVYTALLSRKISQDEIAAFGVQGKEVVKTITHIDSYTDIYNGIAMKYQGKTFTPVSTVSKIGLDERIMIKRFWSL